MKRAMKANGSLSRPKRIYNLEMDARRRSEVALTLPARLALLQRRETDVQGGVWHNVRSV